MPKKVKKAGKKKAGNRKMPKYAMQGMQGEGFWGDVWSGIKKAANFVKDNKLISRGLALVPDGRAQAVGRAAAAIGLGKKRRPRKMKGGAMSLAVQSPLYLHPGVSGASVISA